MASLHLKLAEAAVAVRLADGGALGMLVETGFWLGPAELSTNGQLGTILLFPHAGIVRTSSSQNSFRVNTVCSEQAAVRLTAQFKFVGLELLPTLNVVAVVRRARRSSSWRRN